MQQGMVFNSLYNQNSGVDIEQVVYTLHENLDTTTFMWAWAKVIERHAIMRTGFRWQGLNEPVQDVYRSASPEWINRDWRRFSASEQQQQLAAYLREDRLRKFKLTENSLNRFALFQVGESAYQFVWTFHHAILDGRSLVFL